VFINQVSSGDGVLKKQLILVSRHTIQNKVQY